MKGPSMWEAIQLASGTALWFFHPPGSLLGDVPEPPALPAAGGCSGTGAAPTRQHGALLLPHSKVGPGPTPSSILIPIPVPIPVPIPILPDGICSSSRARYPRLLPSSTGAPWKHGGARAVLGSKQGWGCALWLWGCGQPSSTWGRQQERAAAPNTAWPPRKPSRAAGYPQPWKGAGPPVCCWVGITSPCQLLPGMRAGHTARLGGMEEGDNKTSYRGAAGIAPQLHWWRTAARVAEHWMQRQQLGAGACRGED